MLLSSGKYDYFISGVIKTNKEGQPLKTQKGNAYKKIRLDVLDQKGIRYTIYDAIFNKDRVEQIVNSVGKKELNESFKGGGFQLDELIGEGGRCIIAVKEGKDGYPDQNVVSVYLKPSANDLPPDKSDFNQAQQQELVPVNDEGDDDLPF